MTLTGKFDFRKTFWGKVVLRVEEEVKPFWSKPGALKRRWRDATQMDLADPQMRFVIDMGLKPWSRPASPPALRKGSEQRIDVSAMANAVPVPIQHVDGREVRAGH